MKTKKIKRDNDKIINNVIDDVVYFITNKYCSVGFDIETLNGPDYRLLDKDNFDSFLKEFIALLKIELSRVFQNNNERQSKLLNIDKQNKNMDKQNKL